MTATWTAPRTWVTDELVSAALMNEQLRDNLEFLKSPPVALYNINKAGNYTTTSTSFVDVDSTDLALTITTRGGVVMVGFVGTVSQSIFVFLDVTLDGTRMGGDDGIVVVDEEQAVGFTYLKTGLSAGSHTFKLQWKVPSGHSATLYAGAGTTNYDIHGQFWVKEIS